MKLKMDGICKSFGSNEVLKSVGFQLGEGEICALLGENGAGKSTLMNILGGVLQPDSGDILLDGEKKTFDSPAQSLDAGIAFIHQELNLINDLPIYENMFIGRELKKKSGFLDHKRMIEQTSRVFDRMGLTLDPREMVRNLDASYKQIVEISRALLMDAKIIIMDEPTTSLTDPEIEKVFAILRQLRQQMQADRQALEEQRSQLESRQTELDSQLEAATQLIAKYNETTDGLNDLAAQEKAAADELDAQIQARREEENRNNGGDNSGGSGGGGSSGSDETPSSDGYIWPSDCRLITSGYGGRDQPTPGASTNHMGVDIGASYGSYIYAVKSGTVVGSKYSWGGYGNYVEIDHGNGNFTLYAHMSERLVEVGEYVEQGEVIGLCGSTGISTGPHVHYEIWENYSRINPLNRLPGYIPYWW